MSSWNGPREAGFVDAGVATADTGRRPADRVVVVGGGADTLTLLRMASVRSDDVLLVADRLDGAVQRLADLFAIETREGEVREDEIAGASALLVALGDQRRENAAVRAARRRGVPVHVAGRPLVSDFTLLALVERRPESVAA